MRKPSCDIKGLNKGAWSQQEDHELIDYINKHGKVCWSTLPQAAGLLRCGKSCRLRWTNNLRPDVERGNFAEDEEELVIKLHALLGNRLKQLNSTIRTQILPYTPMNNLQPAIKPLLQPLRHIENLRWSLIAGRLPGRTDNEVRSYWNSHIRRKLISKGIDPNNHRISQKIRPLQNPPMSGSSNKSSGLKDICKNERHGQISHIVASGKDESYALPDLNLDLTISIPSASPTIAENN